MSLRNNSDDPNEPLLSNLLEERQRQNFIEGASVVQQVKLRAMHNPIDSKLEITQITLS